MVKDTGIVIINGVLWTPATGVKPRVSKEWGKAIAWLSPDTVWIPCPSLSLFLSSFSFPVPLTALDHLSFPSRSPILPSFYLFPIKSVSCGNREDWKEISMMRQRYGGWNSWDQVIEKNPSVSTWFDRN